MGNNTVPTHAENLLYIKLKYPLPGRNTASSSFSEWTDRTEYLRDLIPTRYLVLYSILAYCDDSDPLVEVGYKVTRWNMDVVRDTEYLYECLTKYDEELRDPDINNTEIRSSRAACRGSTGGSNELCPEVT